MTNETSSALRLEMLQLMATHLPVDPYEYRNVGRGHAVPVGRIALHVNAGAIPYSVETWTIERAVRAVEQLDALNKYPEEKLWKHGDVAAGVNPFTNLRRILVARDPTGEDFLIDGGLAIRHAAFVGRKAIETVVISQLDAMLTLPENTGVAKAAGVFGRLLPGSKTLAATAKWIYTAGVRLPHRWHRAVVRLLNPAHNPDDSSERIQRIGREAVTNLLQLHAAHGETRIRGLPDHIVPTITDAKKKDKDQDGPLSEEEFFSRLEYKGVRIKSLWSYATINKHKIAPSLRTTLGVENRKRFIDEFTPKYAALSEEDLKIAYDVLLRRQYVLGIVWNQIREHGHFVVTTFNQEERGEAFRNDSADRHATRMYQMRAHAPLKIVDLYMITEATGINVAEYFGDFQRWRGLLDWVAMLHDIKTGHIGAAHRFPTTGSWQSRAGVGVEDVCYDDIPVTPAMAAQWLRFRTLSFAGPIEGPNAIWGLLFANYEAHGDLERRDRMCISALRQFADYAKAHSEYGEHAERLARGLFPDDGEG